jgi:serine/threonine protein kinase
VEDERIGRYRLVRRIGGGGMAEVFRAELEGAEGVTRELVVKKVLHTLSLDREAVEMFVQEARIAARLHHPNVVQVYEFGRADHGYFLAMELVEGCDLAGLLRAHAGASLPLPAVAWVFQELLEGLGYVHHLADGRGQALGLVHRDVSPHNVLLGRAGEVKLADFGIATATARAHDEGVKGKFAYMAPEQARGERLDARADLYAVGAMLYEALAGRRAQPARASEAMLDAARRGAVEPLAEVAPWVDPALAAVVGRAVSPDPEERFPDASAFREALAEAMFVVGAAPDRAAVQAMVRACGGEGEGPRADRTLTSHDDTVSNHHGDASEEELRENEPRRSYEGEQSPRSRPRRLFERGMIAVGIFTLAVLAERRTRPAVAVSAVTVALPEDAGVRRWFEGEGRAAAAGRCRCRVAARYYRGSEEVAGWLAAGEVAVAAVSSVALPAVRPHVSARGELGAAVRPSVARALRGVAGSDGLAPVGVDLVVMAVRDDVRSVGAAGFAARRAGLVVAVDERVGHGLPAGFAWSDDPAGWTWWDVLAAGWLHRPTGARGGVALGLAGERGLAAWHALAGPWTDDRSDANGLRGVVETAGWAALLHALGLVAPTPVEPARDAVFVGPAGELWAAEGWTLYPPPADAEVLGVGPRRTAGGGLEGAVVGWVWRGPAAGPGAAAVFAGMSGAGAARGLARAWRVVPAFGEGTRAVGRDAEVGAQAERLVDRGFAMATCPPRGRPGRVVAALDRVARQATTGQPQPFVGSGRWWWPTVRAAVLRAFEDGETDGGP